MSYVIKVPGLENFEEVAYLLAQAGARAESLRGHPRLFRVAEPVSLGQLEALSELDVMPDTGSSDVVRVVYEGEGEGWGYDDDLPDVPLAEPFDGCKWWEDARAEMEARSG